MNHQKHILGLNHTKLLKQKRIIKLNNKCNNKLMHNRIEGKVDRVKRDQNQI